MDSPPRMPLQHRRPLGRSATNETPRQSSREREERLTPPLEIFVRELSLTERSGNETFDVSSSAMTEITFDGSFCHNNTSNSMLGNGDNVSVTSDVSSVVEDHAHISDSGGDHHSNRLPPRRQSCSRRRRRSRKGVMRWASMPMSNLQSCRQSPDATLETPKLPKRRGSNPSVLSDDDEHEQEQKGQESNRRNKRSQKTLPRLPRRKKSNDSLFSNVKASSSSTDCGTSEIVVGAHAA